MSTKKSDRLQLEVVKENIEGLMYVDKISEDYLEEKKSVKSIGLINSLKKKSVSLT